MAAGTHQQVAPPVVFVAGGPTPGPGFGPPPGFGPAAGSVCATCRVSIAWTGQVWAHQNTNSPWCDASMTTTARPPGP
jgi:hypothetical protein